MIRLKYFNYCEILYGLRRDAVTGFDPNTNKATVEYSNKPGTDNKGESEPSIVYVHTFNFTIFKYYLTDETPTGLANAEFELYKANEAGDAADERAKINIVKVMDLNVKGVFNTTRAASECMIAKGQGVILSTSSMVSIYGQPSGFAYPASKFAVNGLTVSLARELGPKGIRVNAVAPGITLTDMMKAVPKEVIDPLIKQIPLRRLGQPEDIANAFVFLASDEASYITGVVLSVDGMART